jgi:hypothetical protein
MLKLYPEQVACFFVLTTFIIFSNCSQPNSSHNQTKTRMNFRASFCDPFKPDIIELGNIQQENIIQKFESVSWTDYLRRMEAAKEGEIFYSPSLEIENKDTKHGLAISAVGESNNYEFYIFYKRPKTVKTFLGLREKIDEGYTSEKTGQTKQDVLDCLNALLRNDTEYLANKIGK